MHAILEADPPALPAPALQSIPGAWSNRRQMPREESRGALSVGARSRPGPRIDRRPGPAAFRRPIAARRSARSLPCRASWLVARDCDRRRRAVRCSHQRLASPPVTDPPAMDTLTYSGPRLVAGGSPDGKTIAFMSDRDGVPRIWLKQVAAGGELALTEGPDDFPRFSPDGSAHHLRSARRRRQLVALSGAAAWRRAAQAPGRDVAGADWSPDGRQLAFTRWVSGDRAGSVVGVADAKGMARRGKSLRVGPCAGHTALVAERLGPSGRRERPAMSRQASGSISSTLGGGTRLPRVGAPNMRHSSVLWSADSRSVIYSEAESVAAWLSGSSARIVRQDVATGSHARFLGGQSQPDAGRARTWTPAARHAFVAGEPARIAARRRLTPRAG